MVELISRFHRRRERSRLFLRTAQFVDEVLVKFMAGVILQCDICTTVGHHLCPSTAHIRWCSFRIIGWADCSGGYAHPLFHAAKRRNCDGDEDAIAFDDGLLNFSREILLPIGGQMDAPLVLTTRLNPTEIDKEALNVDAACRTTYEATLNQPHPGYRRFHGFR